MKAITTMAGLALLAAGLLLAAPLAEAAGKGKKRSGKAGPRPAPAASKAAGEGGKNATRNPAVVRRQEPYKRVGSTTLMMHIFEPREKAPGRRYPAIVFFFGGGFTKGEPSSFFPQCEHLAGRGMIAMAANYRVSSRQPGTTPVECIKDGKSAIRWARANADRLGIDPARIAAGGGSAGGQIAASAAMVPGCDEAGEDTRVNCRPDALVLFNPGLGYLNANADARDPALFALLYGKKLCPIQNVRPGQPPALIMVGSRDDVLPVPVANQFQAMMRAAGNRCDLLIYPGQRHGFFNYDSQRDHEYYFKTLAEADRFLVSLGWLN